MKGNKAYKVILLGLVFITVACKHEPITPFVENPTEENPCHPDSVYFNRDIMPIIASNCAVSGCHGGGSAQDGVDLTTYASIIATADIKPHDPEDSDFYEAITETDLDKRMPPAPLDPLSPAQIDLIEKWINQGAKNNNCADCNDEIFTFSGAVSTLISANCAGCHSGGSPSGGISLTNYDEIKIQATSGALVGVVKHEVGYAGMPLGLPKLSDCKISQIEKWVNDGAPNN